eukprot:352361-Chlamydomonas_euryale.AAC.1
MDCLAKHVGSRANSSYFRLEHGAPLRLPPHARQLGTAWLCGKGTGPPPSWCSKLTDMKDLPPVMAPSLADVTITTTPRLSPSSAVGYQPSRTCTRVERRGPVR